MKQVNIKKIILPNLPYVLFIYLFDKVGQAFRLAGGADLSAKVLNLGNGFSAALESFGISLHPIDIIVGITGAVIIRLVVYFKGKNAKKYRQGMEYGSARWRNTLMNGTNGNTVQDERGLLPYPVIIAATKGDADAMALVMQRYESYIADLSMRKLRDERGNTYFGIDGDIQDRLRSKLMQAVLSFKV